jgi:hypothetical protein
MLLIGFAGIGFAEKREKSAHMVSMTSGRTMRG